MSTLKVRQRAVLGAVRPGEAVVIHGREQVRVLDASNRRQRASERRGRRWGADG